MARSVINSTYSASSYDLLSQTPKNYSKDNYFLKELQDKINAEWAYRPNRVDLEYEDDWGEQTYSPIEAVLQSVKSEKGTDISNDFRRIVFKDLNESRFAIGSRFSYKEMSGGVEHENVWLSINTNKLNFTSNMVVQRCNGTFGSLFSETDGTSTLHYEPVVLSDDLSSVSTYYNQVAVVPQAQLIVVAQHNDYTKKYFVNQRFIVGYDTVYKVKSINKFYGNSTFDAKNIGLIKIYLELTEASPYDNFDTRIAVQTEEHGMVIIPDVIDTEYQLKFETPDPVPTYITSVPIEFKPVVVDKDGAPVAATITLAWEITNLPTTVTQDMYVDYTASGATHTFARKRMFLGGPLHLVWSATLGSGDSLTFDMNLTMNHPEA